MGRIIVSHESRTRVMADVGGMDFKNNFVISPEIARWECACRVPDLFGLPEGIARARQIRHTFLAALFGQLMDVTCAMDAARAKDAYEVLDEMRAERVAQLRIE